MDLVEAFLVLWQNRILIAAITVAFAALSVAYALTLTHWYRSEMLLAPAEERTAPSIAGQLGNLANLAGIAVGGKGNAEPLAVLQSRDFIRDFIEDKNLFPVLFAEQWDAETSAWKGASDEWPDIREAVKFFTEKVLNVEQNRSTGLVTLSVYWMDPVLAADWATSIVERLNARMREQALKEAEANVTYLRNEMSSTTVVALQQTMGRLLEAELQKLMLARGNEEFAFRVIDSAEVPMSPARPSRRLIVVLATVFGGLLAVLFVYVREVVGNYRSNLRNASAAEE